jgi:hypothetical protein
VAESTVELDMQLPLIDQDIEVLRAVDLPPDLTLAARQAVPSPQLDIPQLQDGLGTGPQIRERSEGLGPPSGTSMLFQRDAHPIRRRLALTDRVRDQRECSRRCRLRSQQVQHRALDRGPARREDRMAVLRTQRA